MFLKIKLSKIILLSLKQLYVEIVTSCNNRREKPETILSEKKAWYKPIHAQKFEEIYKVEPATNIGFIYSGM